MKIRTLLSSALHSPYVVLGVGFSALYYAGGLPPVVATLGIITFHELGHALAALYFGVFKGFGFRGVNPCVTWGGSLGAYQYRFLLLSGLLLSLVVCPFLTGLIPDGWILYLGAVGASTVDIGKFLHTWREDE